MENQNSELYLRYRKYSNAKNIFANSIPDINDIKGNCIFILDTNVLLKPYDVKSEDLPIIKSVYSSLIEQNRLFIPGQVAREFADIRPNKLRNIDQSLSRHQESISKVLKNKFLEFDYDKYSLLSDMLEFKELISIEEELNNKAKIIQEKIKEEMSDYTETLKSYVTKFNTFKKKVDNWNYRDPISLIYAEVFKENVIIEFDFTIKSQMQLEEELNERYKFKIPPGYKDQSKDDKGIGDLIIWHTILQIAHNQTKDIVFVSGDEKQDWFIRGEGKSLYPRFELIHEFRENSPNSSFSIIKFGEFLELFKAPATTVERIENASYEAVDGFSIYYSVLEQAIIKWILSTMDTCDFEIIKGKSKYFDFVVQKDTSVNGILIRIFNLWNDIASIVRDVFENAYEVITEGSLSGFTLVIIIPERLQMYSGRVVSICRREFDKIGTNQLYISIAVGVLIDSSVFKIVETIEIDF